MKYLKKTKNEGGFSLVELMVSVGIIGVMSSVAVPQYQKFTANAAQSEAQASLSSIYTLQTLYFTENSRYAEELSYKDTDTAGAELQYPLSSTSKYNYEIASSGTGNTQFKATAVSKTRLAGCSLADEDKWCINHKKEMQNAQAFVAADHGPCVDGDSVDGSCG